MTEPSLLLRHLKPQLGCARSEELQRVLHALQRSAEGVLRDAARGVYLTGSFALGCGDEASDVDFLVVSSRALTPAEEAAARTVHATLPDRSEVWAHRLDGSWVSAAALHDPVGTHEPWLHVDNGSRVMEHSEHDDTWNSRWVFRKAGVALTGPPAAELLPEVTAAHVKAEAAEQATIRAHWVRDEPEVLLDGWALPYIVLTHCRLLWAATFGTVASKQEAADWVRRAVAPTEYRHLIAASVRYRVQPFDPETKNADPTLAILAGAFVAWATAEVLARASRVL